MAYSYDEMEGSGEPKELGSKVQLAGDVVDLSDTFKNLQQSNAISRTLPKNEPGYGTWPAGTSSWAEPSKPKAPVLPIRPKKGL